MHSVKPHILIVEDDARLRELLEQFLTEQGFVVTLAANAVEARKKLAVFVFDLMILDVMMPGETGLALLRSLPAPPPVLMLTALGDTEQRIEGLESGADDYLVKPFEPRELILRLQAILKRTQTNTQQRKSICFGEYRFDMHAMQLYASGEPVYLTTGEVVLLKTLAENIGNPVSREVLIQAVGGGQNERGIDVQITRLRKKIEKDSSKPVFLQTIRGTGYALLGVFSHEQ